MIGKRSRRWLVPLALPLLAGLTACGSNAPSPPPRTFAAWPNYKTVSGVAAILTAPKTVPARAVLIDAKLTLDNRGSAVVTLQVPNVCAVRDWRVRDASGRLIMARQPEKCASGAVSKALAPGASLKTDAFIALAPGALQAGQRYTIDYRFWGQPARAVFTAE